MLRRFFDWLDRNIESWTQNADIIVGRGSNGLIFWPLSKAAKKACSAQLSKYPRAKGGYMVPDAVWKQEYDKLHHGPCPVIVWQM